MPFIYGGKISSSGGSSGTPGTSENAQTAQKLETARAIKLSGDAIGNTEFDGSKDVEIAVTVNTMTKEEIDKIVGDVK